MTDGVPVVFPIAGANAARRAIRRFHFDDTRHIAERGGLRAKFLPAFLLEQGAWFQGRASF